jgi:hypothetical protein
MVCVLAASAALPLICAEKAPMPTLDIKGKSFVHAIHRILEE